MLRNSLTHIQAWSGSPLCLLHLHAASKLSASDNSEHCCIESTLSAGLDTRLCPAASAFADACDSSLAHGVTVALDDFGRAFGLNALDDRGRGDTDGRGNSAEEGQHDKSNAHLHAGGREDG